MNIVNITGRLAREPEVKKTQNGKSFMQNTVAVKRDKENTDWIPVCFWGQSADFLGQYAKKGDLIEVTGRLQTRSYEQNGQKIYVQEVHASNTAILSHSERENKKAEPTPMPGENQRQNESWGISDEDLPF